MFRLGRSWCHFGQRRPEHAQIFEVFHCEDATEIGDIKNQWMWQLGTWGSTGCFTSMAGHYFVDRSGFLFRHLAISSCFLWMTQWRGCEIWEIELGRIFGWFFGGQNSNIFELVPKLIQIAIFWLTQVRIRAGIPAHSRGPQEHISWKRGNFRTAWRESYGSNLSVETPQ